MKTETTIWAYLDGKKYVNVAQAAFDNHKDIREMMSSLVEENPEHKVTFKILKDEKEMEEVEKNEKIIVKVDGEPMVTMSAFWNEVMAIGRLHDRTRTLAWWSLFLSIATLITLIIALKVM